MPLVVLLADGLRPDVLRCALESGRMPSVARLREQGALYEVSSTFPSVTGPAYTPFLLGRFPGSVGMPGLRWFDRSRRVCTFPDYTRSYVGHQMRAADRDLNPSYPTIFELVPESAAAMTIITRGLPSHRRLAALTPRTALRATRTHFGGAIDAWLKVDRETSDKTLMCVQAKRTRFLFAAFMGIDKISHAHGQLDATIAPALRILDDAVGALLDEQRRDAGLRIWVASDHGHSAVRQHDDLSRELARLGFRVLAHPWVYRFSADVAVMVSGNAMAHLYVELHRRTRPFWANLSARWGAFAEELLERTSVDLLLIPVDSVQCAVWSRTRGRATVSATQNRFSYCTTAGDPLGIGCELHSVSAAEAHDATMPTAYPDSVVQIARLAAAERAGDFILSATQGWDFRARYEPIPHVSSHGALHREHMLVPLILDAPASRAPRRTADVMPSALAALDVSAPAGLDGESFL